MFAPAWRDLPRQTTRWNLVDSGLRDGETPLRQGGRTEPTIGSSPPSGRAFEPAVRAHAAASDPAASAAALPTSVSVLGRGAATVEHDAVLWMVNDLPARMVHGGRRWRVTDRPTRLSESVWAVPLDPPRHLCGWRFQATDDSGL